MRAEPKLRVLQRIIMIIARFGLEPLSVEYQQDLASNYNYTIIICLSESKLSRVCKQLNRIIEVEEITVELIKPNLKNHVA